MQFSGLNIQDSGNDNVIEIDQEANFKRSRITIEGNNNKIILSKTLSYTNFIIHFKGNSKLFEIKPSKKNINGLKFVSIRGENQKFTIGSNFSCGGIEVQMNDGDENVSIGDGCLFSWGIKMRTSDGHSVVDLATNRAINLPKDIHIGDRVWVGEDVKFLKGAIISNDSVVGSNAVVTKAFNEPNCVIVGFPAKVAKTNVSWDRRMPSVFNKQSS
jgi:acetyltransferase-like isoleucine patch superfamily enzyme